MQVLAPNLTVRNRLVARTSSADDSAHKISGRTLVQSISMFLNRTAPASKSLYCRDRYGRLHRWTAQQTWLSVFPVAAARLHSTPPHCAFRRPLLPIVIHFPPKRHLATLCRAPTLLRCLCPAICTPSAQRAFARNPPIDRRHGLALPDLAPTVTGAGTRPDREEQAGDARAQAIVGPPCRRVLGFPA